MPAFALITKGTRFGRLVVVGDPVREKPGLIRYACKCDCGGETLSRGEQLRYGSAQSCGCARKETLAKRLTIHGQARKRAHTLLYDVWCGMKARCSNPKHVSYRYYGAKGIVVGAEFQNFEYFRKWAEETGYRKGLSIDRRENSGNYEPSNCRWVGIVVQNRNSSHTHQVTFDGKTLCLEEWTEVTGVRASTIRRRIKKGWPLSRALKEINRL